MSLTSQNIRLEMVEMDNRLDLHADKFHMAIVFNESKIPIGNQLRRKLGWEKGTVLSISVDMVSKQMVINW